MPAKGLYIIYNIIGVSKFFCSYRSPKSTYRLSNVRYLSVFARYFALFSGYVLILRIAGGCRM